MDENNPDVYEALAIKYLNINCSVMSPNQSRQDYIEQMVKECNIDGLSECGYLIHRLSQKVGREIHANPMGRYAGALGAALIARDGKKLTLTSD